MENSETSPAQRVSLLIYGSGIILGLIVSVMMAWPDLEATFYGFQNISRDGLPRLECPLLLTTGESGVVRATINNPAENEVDPMILFQASTRGMLQEERQRIILAPGGSQVVEWSVGPKNVDLGRFIFVRVFQFPDYGIPMRESKCGTLVLDLPWIKGGQLFGFLFAAAFATISLGLVSWELQNRPLEGRAKQMSGGLRILGVVILATILVGMEGYWFPAIGMIVLSLLTITAVGFFSLTR